MEPLADTAEFDIAGEYEKLFAKHFGPVLPRPQATFGALSDVGKIRKNNEDHYDVVRRHRSRDVLFTNMPRELLPQTREESYTMIVADGLGGCASGEVASMLTLRTAWELTTAAFNWPFKVGARGPEEVMEQLRAYGKRMHQVLIAHGKEKPELAGMGSTITGILLIGADAFVGHVGDSRAYLLRGNALRQLTHDHTQAQQMVDAGLYASVADTPRFMRHVLVNCLGGNYDDVHVETHHVPLRPGDRLLLCTDGLTDMVNDLEIASILNRLPAPVEACQALVDAALEHGGRDNVTVVVAAIAKE